MAERREKTLREVARPEVEGSNPSSRSIVEVSTSTCARCGFKYRRRLDPSICNGCELKEEQL